jgi:hypothetical protein
MPAEGSKKIAAKETKTKTPLTERSSEREFLNLSILH